MKMLNVGAKIIIFFGLWILISLCWVGAEFVFEGVVHSSKVDGYFSGLLAYFVLKDIDHLDKILSDRREGDD